MEKMRSYRRRGAPDFPVALYLSDAAALRKYTKPEYHPETEIVLMLSGTVVMQLDGDTKTFHKGDIYTIPSNAVHCYRVVSDDTKNFSLVFGTAAITLQPEHFFQKAFTLPLSEGILLLPPLLTPEHPAYETVYAGFQLLQKKRIYEKNYKLQRFSALISICTELLPFCTKQCAVAWVTFTPDTQTNSHWTNWPKCAICTPTIFAPSLRNTQGKPFSNT